MTTVARDCVLAPAEMGDARETGNERENQHGCGFSISEGCFELGKMLLLRQTIDGETAFGIF